MNIKMCLDVKTKNIKTNDIIWGVLEAGHECEQIWLDCETNDFNDNEIIKVKDAISKNRVDIVITMDFCPTVSKACYDIGVPYASWIYDSPVQALYHEEANRQTNYFFIFDKHLCDKTRERGLKNVFYLPLAANVTRTGRLDITKEDERNLSSDISFVGVQYSDETFNRYRSGLAGKYLNEYLDFANNMLGRWDGVDRVHNVLSKELIGQLSGILKRENVNSIDVPYRLYFEEAVVPRAVAYTERRMMMEAVRKYHASWYGADAAPEDRIDGIEYLPRLAYEDELPKAYYLSRINVSTSLHSITSGIPLRVFDIMGTGGFVLTNYQPEIEELFEINKEIVVYHDFDELKELAGYYLYHENERLKILVAGYKRVSSEYTYPRAMTTILEKVFK